MHQVGVAMDAVRVKSVHPDRAHHSRRRARIPNRLGCPSERCPRECASDAAETDECELPVGGVRKANQWARPRDPHACTHTAFGYLDYPTCPGEAIVRCGEDQLD